MTLAAAEDVSAFDPWARYHGQDYSCEWKARSNAAAGEAFER